eukprot:1653376-Rhodomonas_salina.2
MELDQGRVAVTPRLLPQTLPSCFALQVRAAAVAPTLTVPRAPHPGVWRPAQAADVAKLNAALTRHMHACIVLDVRVVAARTGHRLATRQGLFHAEPGAGHRSLLFLALLRDDRASPALLLVGSNRARR